MYVVLYAFFNMLTLKRRKELNLFYLVIVVFTIIHLYFLSWDNTSYTPSETLSTTTGIFIPNIDKTEFASDEDFTMADRYTQCKRKDHVAYIKTHKTGSTLMANMIWRLALRRNLHVMTFSRQLYPTYMVRRFMLSNLPYLQQNSHEGEVLAEHVVYNRHEFTSVMRNDTVYISSLREPVSHFKSMVNQFQMMKLLNITEGADEEGASGETMLAEPDVILAGLARFFPGGKWLYNRLRNRSARGLGFNPFQAENTTAVREFITNTARDFKHMILMEHLDESLVVLRRAMCWEIADILYLPLNIRNYTYKTLQLNSTHVKILHMWSSVDFLLYQHYNATLWKDISRLGSDFWNEFEFYTNQKKQLFEFCDPIVQIALEDEARILHLLYSNKSHVIPESPWGPRYVIDALWCLMSKLDQNVFINILRVREHPELCDHIEAGIRLWDMTMRRINVSETEPGRVQINPVFCSRKLTSGNLTFDRVPLPVLLKSAVYCAPDRPAANTIVC